MQRLEFRFLANATRRLAALSLTAAVLAVGPSLTHAALPDVQQRTVAPLLRQITPGVVNIATRTEAGVANPLLQDPFFRRHFGIPDSVLRRETRSSGSGVIVDARNGYVLTNDHVVRDANLIEVTTKDNRRFRAELVGRDPPTDIAVLRIKPDRLTAVPLGDSDRLEVGDFVLAIGNPFGLGQTVTSGIISALGRSGLGIEGFEDFIQTDASINPGNSGGALVNLEGKLIGINTAILAPGGGNIGIGFAVPINMAKRVMDQIVQHGEVRRGRIGIAMQDLTPELAELLGTQHAEGAVVGVVEPNSPAARAGLARGDIVVAVNGVTIRGATHLRNTLGLLRAGEDAELTVERKGDTLTVRVRVEPGGRPSSQSSLRNG